MPLVEAYYLLLHPYTESKCRIFWDYQVWYCFLHCIVMNLREQEEDQSLRNKRGNFTVKERSRSQCTSVFENVQKMYLVLRPHSSLTAIRIITQNISTHEGIGWIWSKCTVFNANTDKSEQNKWRDWLCVLSSHWCCRVKHPHWSFNVLHVSEVVEIGNTVCTFYSDSPRILEQVESMKQAMNPCCNYNGLPNKNRTVTMRSIPQLRITHAEPNIWSSVRGLWGRKHCAKVNKAQLGRASTSGLCRAERDRFEPRSALDFLSVE